MARNIIPDFSREKREYFRRECNFTPREEQLYDLRNQEYSLEECAELIKELMKEQRGKGSRESLVEEACDVLLTTAILLKKHGVEKDEIENRIRFKASKALERWRDSGEV